MSHEREPAAMQELRDLIDRLLDGELSIEESQRLEQLVCSSHAASDYYLQAMQLTAGLARRPLPRLSQAEVDPSGTLQLQDELAVLSEQLEAIAGLLAKPSQPESPAAEPDKLPSSLQSSRRANRAEQKPTLVAPLVLEPSSPHRWFTPATFAVFGAAMLLVGATASWFVSRTAATHSPAGLVAQHREESPQLSPAAYLTSASGVSWGGASPALHRVGSGIGLGEEVAVHEGIAEFRLMSGVLLNIEGPATFVITSPTSLMLQNGKITAKVPWEIKDFRLVAASYQITARDAEIGVIATRGKLEVHSFAGETRLSPLSLSFSYSGRSSHAPADEEEELLREAGSTLVPEGQAVAIDFTADASDAAVKNQLANRTRFASKLSMGNQLPVTAHYVDTVLASAPVSYWRFEEIDARQVRNEVPEGPPLHVVGNVVLSGDPRNYSLEIGSTPGGGHLISDLPVPLGDADYTVEIWCKPSHYHRGTLVGLGFEDERKPVKEIQHQGFLLQTLRNDDSLTQRLVNSAPGSIRYLHRNPPDLNYRSGTSCYTNSLYQLRRWQHVVAAKEGKTMRLYLDGRLSSSAVDRTGMAEGLRVMVGEAYFRRTDVQAARTFFGQLDELAIYDRALNDQEIADHYRAIDSRSKDRAATGGSSKPVSSARALPTVEGSLPLAALAEWNL